MRKTNVAPGDLSHRGKHAVLMAMGAIGSALAIAGWLLLPAGPARSAHSAPAGGHSRTAGSSLANLLSSTTYPAHFPVDCQPDYYAQPKPHFAPPYPPYNAYRLGFLAGVSNGSLSVGPVSVAGISAKVCGFATLGAGKPAPQGKPYCALQATVSVPADGQLFPTVNAAIRVIPGTTSPDTEPEIPFTPAAKSLTSVIGLDPTNVRPGEQPPPGCQTFTDGLHLQATATAGGSAGLFGLSCGLTLTIPLTAVATGPLVSPNPPALPLHGTLTNSAFVIPPAAPTATCPAVVTQNLNQILGLPLKVGPGVLKLPFTAEAYTPQYP